MKKGILSLVIVLLAITIGFSQNRNEDLKKEMDTFRQQMEEAMKQFEHFFDGSMLLKLDTMNLDIQSFGIDPTEMEKHFGEMDMENLNMDDMMKLLELQMNMMKNMDLSQFNQLFEDLGLPTPGIPAPNNENKNQPKSKEGDQKTKPKKKRKTYKL